MPGDRWLAPKREGAKRPTPLSATARGSCYSIFKERWRGTLSRRGQESFAKPGLRTLGRSVSIWLVPQRLFSATYEAFYSRVYRLELEHSARHSAARGSAADVVRAFGGDRNFPVARPLRSVGRILLRCALRLEANKAQRQKAAGRRNSFGTGTRTVLAFQYRVSRPS